jgi:hypothetical protein
MRTPRDRPTHEQSFLFPISLAACFETIRAAMNMVKNDVQLDDLFDIQMQATYVSSNRSSCVELITRFPHPR